MNEFCWHIKQKSLEFTGRKWGKKMQKIENNVSLDALRERERERATI